VTSDPDRIFADLAARQPEDRALGAPISVPALVREWLARGPRVLDGADRAQLDALCRQIDVRKRISAGYGSGWKRLEPETPADLAVVSGVVAVLLANAARVGDAGAEDPCNDGWGLKCANSALKALDAWTDAPSASELRGWAADVIGRVRDPAGAA
jgi:hypothetical protein